MWIVSSDLIFAEALQITLRENGISAEILSALPPRPWEADGWILDLDTIAAATLPTPAITFTRSVTAHPDADLIRPFLFRELVALIRERLTVSASPSHAPKPNTALPFLKLLPKGVLMGGKQISLSPAERAILALLLEHPGECVPKERIDALWQDQGSNTTAVYIRYLRKKLDEPSGLRLIRSIRGRGYCLCLPE